MLNLVTVSFDFYLAFTAPDEGEFSLTEILGNKIITLLSCPISLAIGFFFFFSFFNDCQFAVVSVFSIYTYTYFLFCLNIFVFRSRSCKEYQNNDSSSRLSLSNTHLCLLLHLVRQFSYYNVNNI